MRREHLRLATQLAGGSILDPVLPNDEFVTLGDLRFHYLDWGHSDQPPVVFLHGAGLTAHTWDIACSELQALYHCVALDLRGHGDSSWDPRGDYGFDAFGSDIDAFLKSVNAEHAILVGHSLGGLAALGYALGTGRTVRGLVLVDIVLRPSAKAGGSIRGFMTAAAELDTVEDFVERAMQFNPRRDRRLLRFSLQQNLRKLPNGKFTWKYDRQAILGRDPAASERFRLSIAERIRTLHCPILVIRGENSEVVTPDDAAAMAAAAPNGNWKQVPRAGHTVQGDNPIGLVKVLRGFLDAVASR
jgi:esterase